MPLPLTFWKCGKGKMPYSPATSYLLQAGGMCPGLIRIGELVQLLKSCSTWKNGPQLTSSATNMAEIWGSELTHSKIYVIFEWLGS